VGDAATIPWLEKVDEAAKRTKYVAATNP